MIRFEIVVNAQNEIVGLFLEPHEHSLHGIYRFQRGVRLKIRLEEIENELGKPEIIIQLEKCTPIDPLNAAEYREFKLFDKPPGIYRDRIRTSDEVRRGLTLRRRRPTSEIY